LNRIHFGPGRTVSLDFGKELWKWDAVLYESVPVIAAERQRAGRPHDDDSVLSDVVHWYRTLSIPPAESSSSMSDLRPRWPRRTLHTPC
jgi:hypothetical protein